MSKSCSDLDRVLVFNDPLTRPCDGVIKTLNFLKISGFKYAIATTSPKPRVPGRLVQVDPGCLRTDRCRLTQVIPVLTALGFSALKLKYDEALSKSAFNFNLRRYNLCVWTPRACATGSQMTRSTAARATSSRRASSPTPGCI